MNEHITNSALNRKRETSAALWATLAGWGILLGIGGLCAWYIGKYWK
jgi:hypothetical protein